MRTARILAVFTLAAVMGLVFAIPHAVAGGNEVRRSGNCEGSSDWKLKIGPDDGRLEVEFEVDQNLNGDTWRITMKHDGVRFFRGRRTTVGPSGSFEVRRLIGNNPGTDRVVARARNLSTDEVCRGSASI